MKVDIEEVDGPNGQKVLQITLPEGTAKEDIDKLKAQWQRFIMRVDDAPTLFGYPMIEGDVPIPDIKDIKFGGPLL